MKKSSRSLLGGLVIAAGALGAIGAAVIGKNKKTGRRRRKAEPVDAWARPGMTVVLRAELMPGRDASERLFQVAELLPSGRVLLVGVTGEHAEGEFERLR